MSLKVSASCNALILAAFIAAISSCNGKEKSSDDISTYQVSVEVDSLAIECPAEYRVLPSYTEVDCYTAENGNVMLAAYNYKSNSIELLDLTDKRYARNIGLATDGPDGIPGSITWIQQIGCDSLLVFDRLKLYLVDSLGREKNSYVLPGGANALTGRNARSNVACLYYDKTAGTVAYPVADGGKILLKEYSLAEGVEKSSVEICDDDPGGRYGFYRYPNVSVTDSVVIYNYAFDRGVKVMSRIDGSVRCYDYDSHIGGANPVECTGDPEEMTWHGFENPAYFDFTYLEGPGVYVQVALGATTVGDRSDMKVAAMSRPVFIRVFDPDFNMIDEIELPAGRFNPFCGWFTTDDGVMLFNDNALSPNDTEDTIKLSYYRLKAD